jgi:hypothetical protein
VTLFARAKRILIAPEDAWREIDQEETSALDVLVRYALPLALLGPVLAALFAKPRLNDASFGMLVLGGVALNLVAAATIALATVFVSAVVGGKRDFGSAVILACYSATSVWLSSAAVIAPERAVFAIAFFGGLAHSLYVFHIGLEAFLKMPHDASGIGTAVIMTLTLAALVGVGWGLAHFV